LSEKRVKNVAGHQSKGGNYLKQDYAWERVIWMRDRRRPGVNPIKEI